MRLRKASMVAAVCVLAATLAAQGTAAREKSAKTAAPDYSGRYSFLQEGEDLQLDVTEGRVDGYITRFGDSESDRGTLLNHYLAKAALEGDKLTFSSKPVHAVWYEFTGKIGRGAAKSKSEDGFYQIVGTLTEHRQKEGKEVSARERQVVFKLFAEENDATAK